MDCLQHTVIWNWCRANGIALDEGTATHRAPQLAQDPTLDHRSRVSYADRRRSGREPTLAADAVHALGDWDECLVWVTGWGDRPSSEDWPRFYAWRGSHGARRSLESAPGHVFWPDEAMELQDLFTQVMEYAWDATVLPTHSGSASGRRLVVSHDGWIEIQSRRAITRPFTAPDA